MNGSVVVGEKITDEEKKEHLEELEEEEMVVILEDGMFTNSTGTYYANGTAVIPEFGTIAMIVLATAIIGTIVIVKRGSVIGQNNIAKKPIQNYNLKDMVVLKSVST